MSSKSDYEKRGVRRIESILPLEACAELDRWAAAEDRSTSGLLRRVLLGALDQRRRTQHGEAT